MTTVSQPGARAQHKARTRAAIRSAALELIAEQGYHATTLAQIARKAGVSHTTLFRYFESKEQVIVADDVDDVHRQTLGSIPPGLHHFDLFRRIITDMFAAAAQDPWASDPERRRLISSDPVLRMAHQVQIEQTIAELTEFVAEYLGIAADSFPLRVFIGAVAGLMMTLADHTEIPDDTTLTEFLQALDLMERGFPLND